MNKASEPIDILWKNLGVIESHYSFTRMFIFFGCLMVVLFLSSPAVMLAKLQDIDPTEFLAFGWSKYFGWLGPYVHRSLPPTFVLGINSTILLKKVIIQIKDKNYKINNLDVNIITETPKLKKFKNKIEKNISKLCEIPLESLNVKAKTTEKLGVIGREKAIASEVIVSVIKYD